MEDILPDYEIWTNFICDRTIDAIETDSYVNTHPIKAEINDPQEIDDMFDTVTYHKGKLRY